MSTLYLLKYNNYYNHIVKKEKDVKSYLMQSQNNGMEAFVLQNVNFMPNDYVDTRQVVNIKDNTIPDYMLVVEDDEIKSRWFVIASTHTTYGQLELHLHRDVMVDYYDAVVSSPVFIEKATITNRDNPLLYNSENMGFNQIKKSETLIRDESQCPWLIVYCDQKSDISGSFESAKYQPIKTYTAAQYESTGLKHAVEQGSLISKSLSFKSIYLCCRDWDMKNNYTWPPFMLKMTGGSGFSYIEPEHVKSSSTDAEGQFTAFTNIFDLPYNSFPTYPCRYAKSATKSAEIASFTYNNYWSKFRSEIENNSKYVNADLYSLIEELRGGIIKIDDDYYQVNTTYTSNNSQVEAYNTSLQLIKDYAAAMINAGIITEWGYNVRNYMAAEYSVSGYKISLTKLTGSANYTYDLKAADRMHNIDAPYDICCIPFSDTFQIRNSGQSDWTNVECSKQFALDFAKTLMLNHGGDSPIVYDAQIVPYCPITYADFNKEYIDLNTGSDQTYDLIESASPGCVIWCDKSSFQRTIPMDTPVNLPFDAMEAKINNDCDMYRIVSPNFSGAFEFNAMKNGGLDSFQINCTYKPYNPYIKVYPTFGFLYGSSYNDDRAMVCTGDFSLPRASDAWATFERQNVNYQKTFDRQIQNMETKNDIEQTRDTVNAVTGAIGGLVSGAGTGAMMGSVAGPAGMLAGGIIGGLIGGAASGVAGGVDVAMNNRLRKEEVNFARDNFNLQLGNIKALPTTLSKTTAYNIDNKYFPFLEYYTCTDEEKQMFRQTLKYRGMTIGAIATISEYQLVEQSYIRGRLVRLENADVDYNISNAIADELYQGVFI